MAVPMFLTSVNIRRAENGVIVGLSLESDDKINTKFDHKEHVFEKGGDAMTFISKKIDDIIETKSQTKRAI